MITSLNKKRKKIEIQCYQLHKLVNTFSAALGSTTRLTSNNDAFVELNLNDSIMIQNFLDGNDRYFTSGQKLSSDFNDDGIVTDEDLHNVEVASFSPLLGDINADGVVNILDLQVLIEQILGDSPTEVDLDIFDMNEDGVVNIVDAVAMVNYILSGGD